MCVVLQECESISVDMKENEEKSRLVFFIENSCHGKVQQMYSRNA